MTIHFIVEDSVHPYKRVICTDECYHINEDIEENLYEGYSFDISEVTCKNCIKRIDEK